MIQSTEAVLRICKQIDDDRVLGQVDESVVAKAVDQARAIHAVMGNAPAAVFYAYSSRRAGLGAWWGVLPEVLAAMAADDVGCVIEASGAELANVRIAISRGACDETDTFNWFLRRTKPAAPRRP